MECNTDTQSPAIKQSTGYSVDSISGTARRQSICENPWTCATIEVATLATDRHEQNMQLQQQSFDTTSSVDSESVNGVITPDLNPNSIYCNEPEDHRSSLIMTAFNVINSVIGYGIIGIPYALNCSGIGLGLLLLVIIAIITVYSMNLIIVGGALSNTLTYQDMVRVAFGKPGHIAITVIQGLYPLITMISYNILIGDSITKIAMRISEDRGPHSLLANRNFVAFLATLFVCMPLSLYKNISKLSKTSLLSTLIVCLIMISMAVRATSYAPRVVPENFDWSFTNDRIPHAICIISAAFMCQHNTYLCFHSLQRRSLSRWSLVTHMAVGFSMLSFALFGLIGFATFASSVQSNILENYCSHDDLINFSRLLFAATIVLTYPMECFVVREVIENYFFQQLASPLWRHVTLTGGIVCCAFLASMATKCLGIVLQLNGIFTAVPMAFILPPLCVMRLQNEPFFRLTNLPLLATAAFGCVVASSGFIVVVMDLWHGMRCTRGEPMPYCLPGVNSSTSYNFG